MFVRYVSHEIRTPLNTVSMGIQLAKEELRKGEDPDAILDILEDVHSSSDTAVEILNGLLTFDKIDSGNMVLDVEPVAVYEFVSENIRAATVQASLSHALDSPSRNFSRCRLDKRTSVCTWKTANPCNGSFDTCI